MISNIEITGNKYKVEDSLSKYVRRRLGKLDHYLPRAHRSDLSLRLAIEQINRPHGNKYEIHAEFLIPTGKTLAAKTETANVFSGVDIIEAKLMGQARRFKTEIDNQKPKGIFRRFLKKAN